MSVPTNSVIGPVVLVTGCSVGGIGASLASKFAEAGCTVYATARRLEAMDGLKEPSGPNVGLVRKVQLDITSDESVQSAVAKILEETGRIDILVNNAGILCPGPVLEVDLDTVHAAFNTNVFATLRTVRAVVPGMAARKCGLVLNVGSITAIVPIPFAGIYAATKTALQTITETLYVELQPLGVNVMLLEPGGIRSNIDKNASPKFSLPSNSLYHDYLPRILARISTSQASTTMDTDHFASQVVRAALPANLRVAKDQKWDFSRVRRYMSIGDKAWPMYALSWLPRGVALWLLWQRFGSLRK